jgi:hypothetical protein
MRRISSRLTLYYKRVFPILTFGFLAIFIALPIGIPLLNSRPAAIPPLPFFLVPIFMAVVFYFVLKIYVFDLVDEALDDGDTLVVKKGGRNDRIALWDIKNVSYSPLINPPRVTMSLRKTSAFGDKVSFAAPIRFIPFSTHPVVDAWIEHVDAVREAHWRSQQH